MKTKTKLAAAMLSFTMVSAAAAADLPYNRAAPTQRFSYYNWQGWYLGGNVGYQWGNIANAPHRPEGFAGGLHFGYNWQTGQFVYGFETDIQLSGADDVIGATKFTNSWFGTLRGRGGVIFNNVILYGTAGLAYGGLRGEAIGGASESKTVGGWSAGAGMEIGLTPTWSARAEYLFVDLPGRGYAVTGVKNGIESSILRFGASYRF